MNPTAPLTRLNLNPHHRLDLHPRPSFRAPPSSQPRCSDQRCPPFAPLSPGPPAPRCRPRGHWPSRPAQAPRRASRQRRPPSSYPPRLTGGGPSRFSETRSGSTTRLRIPMSTTGLSKTGNWPNRRIVQTPGKCLTVSFLRPLFHGLSPLSPRARRPSRFLLLPRSTGAGPCWKTDSSRPQC